MLFHFLLVLLPGLIRELPTDIGEMQTARASYRGLVSCVPLSDIKNRGAKEDSTSLQGWLIFCMGTQHILLNRRIYIFGARQWGPAPCTTTGISKQNI